MTLAWLSPLCLHLAGRPTCPASERPGMALGGATKKLQNLVDTAEELYQRINELREEIHALRQTVQSTNASVERIERDLEEQRAMVEALARDQGVDIDTVIAEATIREAEPVDTEPAADVSEGSDEESGAYADDGTGSDTGPTGVSEAAKDEGGAPSATSPDSGNNPDSSESNTDT